MDFNKRITDDNNLSAPFYLKPLIWILEILPYPNTVLGMILYTLSTYLFILVLKIIVHKFSPDEAEQTKKEAMK